MQHEVHPPQGREAYSQGCNQKPILEEWIWIWWVQLNFGALLCIVGYFNMKRFISGVEPRKLP